MNNDVLPLVVFVTFLTLAVYLILRIFWQLIPRSVVRGMVSFSLAVAVVLGFFNDLKELVFDEPTTRQTIWQPIQDVRRQIAISVCSFGPRYPSTIGYLCQLEPPQPRDPLTIAPDPIDVTGSQPVDTARPRDENRPGEGNPLSLQPVASETGQEVEHSPAASRAEAATTRIPVRIGTARSNEVLMMQPGLGRIETFRDCPRCPEMVVIPKGSFVSGGRAGRRVTISKPFAISSHEITVGNWRACVEAGTCQTRPQPQRSSNAQLPVVNVSYGDASRYAAWLSTITGETYRLPSIEEWEYAARSTSEAEYWWQRGEINALYANFRGSPGQGSIGELEPVDRYPQNFWGLYNVHGNAAEWTKTCATGVGGCGRRAVRGGSRKDFSDAVTLTAQIYMRQSSANEYTGFRVMRELSSEIQGQ
jgi:formylglycine-generating enzyme required for sulfatase activity